MYQIIKYGKRYKVQRITVNRFDCFNTVSFALLTFSFSSKTNIMRLKICHVKTLVKAIAHTTLLP